MQSDGCLDRQLKNRMCLAIIVAESSVICAKARNSVGLKRQNEFQEDVFDLL